MYFAVTGTPDGGRNELSLKNEFSVLVSRLLTAPTSAAATQSTSPSLQQPPAQSPSQVTGMTPEQEARAREALRRTIAELEQTNAPSAKPTNP